MTGFHRVLAILALCLAPVLAAASEAQITLSVDGTEQSLSDTEIRAAAAGRIETETSWMDGVQVFEGALAADLLAKAGVVGGTLTLSALDGYSVEMPYAALTAYPALLAYRLNGEALDPEGFGPYWLVFDYDEIPEADRERYAGYSVWALSRIAVE